MRRLRRPGYEVPTMLETGPAGVRRLELAQKYAEDSTIPFDVRRDFRDHWRKSDVKGLLRAMQANICAYCGSEFYPLDVDHFRPKNIYWWLAYEPSNYFLACTGCNRNKGARFPLLLNETPWTYEKRETIALEPRVFLDPAIDPVEEWIDIEWSNTLAKLIPSSGLGEGDRRRVQSAIDVLRLNIEPAVVTPRSEAYERGVRAASEQRWDDLRQSALRCRPHSLVARIVLSSKDQPLPTPEDELNGLLLTLWKELRILAHANIDRGLRNVLMAMDERQIETICWSLIVLLKDPPAVSNIADQLQLFINQESLEIRREIETQFERIAAVAPHSQGNS